MPKNRRFFVYIVTNRPRSHTLYTGITGNLPHRIFQHKNKLIPGFTSKYNLTRLVYTPMRRSPARRKLNHGGEARRFV
jgi:putative endonuclease